MGNQKNQQCTYYTITAHRNNCNRLLGGYTESCCSSGCHKDYCKNNVKHDLNIMYQDNKCPHCGYGIYDNNDFYVKWN
jgi:hypothetical protein